MILDDYKFVLCSNDPSIMQLFNACMRHYGVNYQNSQILTRYRDLEKYIQAIDDDNKRVYIIEKKIEEACVEDSLSSFKSICRDNVIVMSYELSQDEIYYYFEFGIKSFITKPISLNKLVEKIKNTVMPNKRLSLLIDECRSLIKCEKLQEARQKINQIFDHYPQSTRGYLLLGEYYDKINDSENAERYYLEAHNTEKLFVEPIKTLINFYRKNKQHSKELSFIKEYINCSPLSFDIRTVSIEHCIEHKAIAKAVDEIEYVFEKILQRTSVENEGRLKKIFFYTQCGDESVIESVARHTKNRCDLLMRSKYVHPFDHCFFVEGTKIHLSLQKYDDALMLISHLPIKNASSEHLFIYAVSLFYNKEYKKAASFLLDVVKEVGASEALHIMCQCYITCCHICSKEIGAAKENVEAMLKLHPDNRFFRGIEKYLSTPDVTHRLVETKILKSINYDKLCDFEFN